MSYLCEQILSKADMLQKLYRKILFPILTVLLVTMASCRFTEVVEEDDGVYHEELMRIALQLCERNTHPMGDRSLAVFYKEKDRICWLNDFSDTVPVQSFLKALSVVHEHGLLPEQFHFNELSAEYELLRSLSIDSLKRIPERVAALDYHMTESYFFYVRGMHFGFMNPDKVFNNLEKSEPRYPGDKLERMKRLYDIPVQVCDSLYLSQSLEKIGSGLEGFLSGLYPRDHLYRQLMKNNPSSEKESLSRMATLEMLRWRPVDPVKESRRIYVNLASQELTAYNGAGEPVVQMKICCGSLRHKSPMLTSEINRLEVNPYWNVPVSIVRREVIPGYRKDSTYFTRQRMKVYDRQRQEVSPHEIEWDEKAEKIPYSVRQDNGASNSLGHIIFRFPNNFDVYLHDTNNRAAFQYKNRAVSHGCIRLEKPLALLAFLEPDATRYERIQKAMKPDDEGGYHLKHFSFQSPVDLAINYHTAGLGAEGEVVYYQDPYGYDAVVCAKLKTVNSD